MLRNGRYISQHDRVYDTEVVKQRLNHLFPSLYRQTKLGKLIDEKSAKDSKNRKDGDKTKITSVSLFKLLREVFTEYLEKEL
jgi:hypothetical protein